MSTTVDERVVEMRFDNKQFEQNIQTSLSSLDKLKKSLNLEGAAKGLETVNDAANKCSGNMSPLSNAVETVRVRFSALEVMAITALQNITNSALAAGKNLVSAFTIDPIKTGFEEYETQINAVQTILANTSSKGTTLDQVNNALDELSGYIDFDYYENEHGEVIVTAENVPFVTSAQVTEMGTRQVDNSALLIPIWPGYDRDVFNLSNINNMKDTDKGELKGLLVARGSIEVNYTDVPVMPEKEDYDLTTADGLQAYNDAMDAYNEKQEYYNKYIEPSAILSAIAGFDKLVNGIVTSLNDILCPEKTIETTKELTDNDGNVLQADEYIYNASVNATLYDRYGKEVKGVANGDGTYSYSSGEKLYVDQAGTTAETIDNMKYSVLDTDKAGFGMDKDMTMGVELFKREGTERYIQITAADGTKTYVRNNLNTADYETDYTLGKLLVNPEASQHVDRIPLSTIQGKEDFSKANELIDAFSKKFASLNPDSYAKADFNSFYNDYIGEFATVGKVLSRFVNNQTSMVDGYDNQRLQTSGVSSDEELEKMIKYQHAYNAASRYINVVSEMIEHLVTSLGS